jgi:nickel-type superoxide dismutase maturation protease
MVAMAGAAALVWGWGATHSRLERVKVAGPSMLPGLRQDDRLVVWRARSVRRGDIVAAVHPDRPGELIVKRVARLGPEGAVLLGDNQAQSTDSRHFGPVPRDLVRGRAVYRYAPPSRVGRLARGRV